MNKLVAINPFKPGHYNVDGKHAVYLADEVEAEIGRLKAESDLLKAALRWALENGAVKAVHHIDGVRHVRLVSFGDFDSLAVPPQFAPLIAEAMKQEICK